MPSRPLPPASVVHTPAAPESRSAVPGSLASELALGRGRAAIVFAGQGNAWVEELASLVEDRPRIAAVVKDASDMLHRLASDPEMVAYGQHPAGLDPWMWITRPETRPSASDLAASAVSQPLVLLTQVARWMAVEEDGLAQDGLPVFTGHSQGMLAAIWLSEGGHRLHHWLTWATWQGVWMEVGADADRPAGDATPMAAVAGPTAPRLQAVVDAVNACLPEPRRVVISLFNTASRHVVSGPEASLSLVRTALEQGADAEKARKKAGRFGGTPLSLTWTWLPVSVAFHTWRLTWARDRMRETAQRLGLGVAALRVPVINSATGALLGEDATSALLDCQFIAPVRWPATTRALAQWPELTHVLDLGPGDGVSRLTAANLRGAGLPVLPLTTPQGQEGLFTAGAAPKRPLRYADFKPRLLSLPDGALKVDNRYTRLTGQSPIILPGMTPTTAEVPVVAAAANAGFTAELAGGGQPTARILDLRLEELASQLEPGAEVVFNALYLDRYLWNLHLGDQARVLAARRAGAPIRGVTISAGIPEVDEAVALLDKLAALDMDLNAFKPGTSSQVDQVIAIAQAAAHHTVFMHLEGGRAGGHHSWEDLEELLLSTYHRVRAEPNLVLCVGGGIADEARATALLTGTWSRIHGRPDMPVDAVFLGTLTMATKEAMTSPQVKAALVHAAGCDDWVFAGEARGDVTSGRSGLGADIHYLDNPAARCGKLLDELAGDADAVLARREELIEVLNATAKPYFGDVDTMTWSAVLRRLVELLAVGRHGRYEDGPFLDTTWRARVFDALHRAEGRLCPEDEGTLDSIAPTLADLSDPEDVLNRFEARYPDATTRRLHPADVSWFVDGLCARPGKPVPFVPVIDANVRRWYSSDSLWQAHDDRFAADQVLVIPGPKAVAGIVKADEPVAELLGRFEEAVVAELVADGQRAMPREMRRRWTGETPPGVKITSRRRRIQLLAGPDAARGAWCDTIARHISGPIAAAFGANRVRMGDTLAANPLRALCITDPDATMMVVPDPRGRALRATWRSRGDEEIVRVDMLDAALKITVATLDGVRLELMLHAVLGPDGWRFHRPADEPQAIAAALYLRNGPVDGGVLEPATADTGLDVGRLTAWRSLTGHGPGTCPPDHAFSLAWPAILETLCRGELVGGLLRLVHAEHEVTPGPAWSSIGANMTTEARVVRVEDTVNGRLVDVVATLTHDGALAATLRERFVVRGDHSHTPWRLRAHQTIDSVLDLSQPGASRWLESRPWLQLDDAAAGFGTGEVSVSARLAWQVTRAGRASRTAVGRIRVDGEAVGRVASVQEGRGDAHPVVVALELLKAPAAKHDTPRRTLGTDHTRAPALLSGFAVAGGDDNPIHRSPVAARLAGLDAPIVHGMWTSARAQAAAVRHAAGGDASRLTSWTSRFLAPVALGATLEMQVVRTGLERGETVVDVNVTADGAPVLSATARIAPPTTAWVFPGQGIQAQGMGMDAYGSSAAARKVWDQADAWTRANLGFSVLHVVRANPAELIVAGERFRHPKGVLHLTRFTQVSMAVLAFAQVETLREAGAFHEGGITAGHSVGEYNALGACMGVLPLESIIEVVYHRGAAMERLVPRDAEGRSAYAMGVARPAAAGLDQAGLEALVARVAAESGSFLEVVNYNVRDVQYAIAGEIPALKAMQAALEARALPGTKKSPWVMVPGVDVPFHSTRLRAGVPAFRATLERCLPADMPWQGLVDRYVPNLVARPFRLDRDMMQAVADVTDSSVAAGILCDWAAWSATPARLARTLLVELLAWQFASPVRWIQTQELLFGERRLGGLGVKRLIEVGAGHQPTLRNLAGQSLKRWSSPIRPVVHLLHAEADAMLVLCRDADPVVVEIEEPAETDAAPAATAAAPVAAPVVAASATAPTDATLGVDGALRLLLALQAGIRVDQVTDADTIEALVDGVSARRNQLLLDLGAEFDAGTLDGAHERPIAALAGELTRRLSSYEAPGAYLSAARDAAIGKVFGRARLDRPGLEAELSKGWGLGPGLATWALLLLAAESREGASRRGGPLGRITPVDRGGVDGALELLVASLSEGLGTPLGRLGTGGGEAGAMVDAGALAAIQDALTGPDGALMTAARSLAGALGHRWGAEGEGLPEADPALARLSVLEAELGPDYAARVAPRFDRRRHVLMDDAWAIARREVVALAWDGQAGRLDAESMWSRAGHLARHAGDAAVATSASFLAARARAAGYDEVGRALERIAAGETDSAPFADADAFLQALYAEHAPVLAPGGDLLKTVLEQGAVGAWDLSGRTALVTGASPGSIAFELVRHLLRGGAEVIATTSRPTRERVAAFRTLYSEAAAPGAVLHVVPFNQASRQDVDALLDWVLERDAEADGALVKIRKSSLTPDLLVPFAAMGDAGTLDTVTGDAEAGLRLMLLGVERLITGLAGRYRDRGGPRCHVLVPGSPNHGDLGGDGLYAEAKAALEVLPRRWASESDAWGSQTSLVEVKIGWVRGTGLMKGNDPLASHLEDRTGVRTYASSEMGWLLAGLCTEPIRVVAECEPVRADLGGGLGDVPDLKGVLTAIRAELRDEAGARRGAEELETRASAQLDAPNRPAPVPVLPDDTIVAAASAVAWPALEGVDLSRVAVIVGVGEIGTCGTSRTRHALEVDDQPRASAVQELAWLTGLVRWDDTKGGRWVDGESGEEVLAGEIAERYRDAVRSRVGVRTMEAEMLGFDAEDRTVLERVYLDRELVFTVEEQAVAASFQSADPKHTRVMRLDDGRWQVTRLEGAEIRVPRRDRMSRRVAGQVPTGLDMTRLGLSEDMIERVDRVTLFNLISTADAFASCGMSPEEMMSHVHPARVACTQGTGIGGMRSLSRLYTDRLMGKTRQHDILQESLGNVVAAWPAQAFTGGYGAMAHPVGACATAAVSLEEGLDKILAGKADMVVTGGFDDLGQEGSEGFSDMQATCDTDRLEAMGLEPDQMSRANDLRRRGFVEAQGGGTLLLARGDVAQRLGLPVLGVLGFAGSFGDGIHRSIPAPGLGALACALGGEASPMAEALRTWGLTADDIAVVSKHDTSTTANDPNVAELHSRIQTALGRTEGNPLLVVSQKALTGHAKGGAAAWQTIGLCQLLEAGVVPGNRNLTCADPVMKDHTPLVLNDRALHAPADMPLRAGILTSLGFGHVSSVVMVVHPAAFAAALSPDERAAWRAASDARLAKAARHRAEIWMDRRPLFEKRDHRRFSAPDGTKVQRDEEAALLTDPEARFDLSRGVYR